MTDNDPTHEEIARRLAEESDDAGQPVDSTLENVRGELETLAESARTPLVADSIDNESDLDQGLEFVRRMGRELTHMPAAAELPDATELRQIREYQILEKLGQGGMGTVFKAVHTKLNRVVALKVLPAEKLNRTGAVERFEREMAAVGALSHPNIVAASDAGESDGVHYLVMELVDGFDLSSLVDRVGRLPVPDACEIIRQAADGLQHAHQKGTIHRDIKPSNIMLAMQDDGPPIVKVLDLGLALLDESEVEDERALTSTGQMMGTFDYMAPEQGTDSHAVDARTDVYALGATLFKLLTGEAPFNSRKYSTAFKLLTAKMNSVAPSVSDLRPDVPLELSDLIGRMLSIDPDQRPTSAADVIRDLQTFVVDHDLSNVINRADEALTTDESGEIRTTMIGSAPVATDTAVEKPSERPVVEGQENKFGRMQRWLFGGAAAAALALVAWAIVLQFPTEKGTVFIEADGLEISEILLDGDPVVFRPDSNGKGYEFSVAPKTAVLTLKTPDGRVLKTSLTEQKLTIKTGPAQKITAWLQTEPGNTPHQMSPTDAKVQFAQWVLEKGGQLSIGDNLIEVVDNADAVVGRLRVNFWNVPFGDVEAKELGELYSDQIGRIDLLLAATSITDDGLHALASVRFYLLDLSDTSISDAGLETVGRMPELHELRISRTNVTGPGLAALDERRDLVVLFVDGLKIVDDDLKHIKSLPLCSLLLRQTAATDIGVAQLGPSMPLEVLSIPGNLSEFGMGRIVESFPNLRELFLYGSRTQRLPDTAMATIASLSKLTRLELHEVGLTNKDLEVISGMQQLNELHLNVRNSQNVPSVDSLTLLRSMENLHHLHLSYANLTEAHTDVIASLPGLKVLKLRGDSVSDKTTAGLAACSQLESLDLRESAITATGLARLNQALPKCQIQSDLPTAINSGVDRDRRFAQWVLDRGGELRLAIGARRPRVMTVSAAMASDAPFDVSFSGVSDFGDADMEKMQQLAPAREIHNMDLDSTAITSAGISVLPYMELRVLSLANTSVDNSIVTTIQSLPRLKYLTLEDTNITGESLAALAECQRLIRLNLNGLEINDGHLVHLMRLPELNDLSLPDTNVTDDGLDALAGIQSIRNLRLSSPVTSVGISKIVRMFPDLHQFVLGGEEHGGLGDEAIAEAAKLQRCEILRLMRTSSTDESLWLIAAMPALKHVQINTDGRTPNAISGKGIGFLMATPTIEDLEISGLRIADEDMAVFGTSRCLSSLSIANIPITDAGLKHLEECKTLRELALRYTSITASGISRLREALPNCVISVTPKIPSAAVKTSSPAISFDGHRDFVALPFRWNGTPMTIEAWVIPERDGQTGNNLVSTYQGGGFGLHIDRDLRWTCWCGQQGVDGGYAMATEPRLVEFGKRQHVAGVFDGTSVSLFVNGQRVATVPHTGRVKNSELNFMLGANPGPDGADGNQYRGTVEAIRFSNGVRYHESFEPSALTTDETTIALYDTTSIRGVTLKDLSGNANDGVIGRTAKAGQKAE